MSAMRLPRPKSLSGLMLIGFTIVAAPLLFATLGVAGLASAQQVVVDVPPVPVARVEVQPARPSPEHIWIRGYWSWRHAERRYVWVPGYWMHQHVTIAPPAVRVENPGPPPSIGDMA